MEGKIKFERKIFSPRKIENIELTVDLQWVSRMLDNEN
jgi:hypothetical protein